MIGLIHLCPGYCFIRSKRPSKRLSAPSSRKKLPCAMKEGSLRGEQAPLAPCGLRRTHKEREEPGFLSTTAAAGTALELKLNLRRVLKLVMVGKGIGG